MDFDSFKLLCFTQGIDTDIIEATRPFINEHDLELDNDRPPMPASTLGYAELADIITVEQGVSEIKHSIRMSTCDYDNLGRNISKLRTKQLINSPSKGLCRVVLKAFYLCGGETDGIYSI
jgi:hypothetical protein